MQSNNKLAQRLIPLWFLCYTGLTWAATFAQDVRAFDVESLVWAAAAGLMGGALRTILTLASDKREVYDILREARKDAVVSLIAGLGAYLVVLGVNSMMTTYFDITAVPRDLRILIIVGAGWARMGFFKKLDQATESALRRMDKTIQGNDPGPSSEAAPLEK